MRKWLAAVLFAASSLVQAQADVALVEFISGEVTYASGAGAAAKATPFMKVREGDRFTVVQGSQLRLLYFQSAKQEHFTGPASFAVGSQASKLQSGSAPRVASVPVAVPRRIARIPELLENAKLGGVQLRGKPPARADDAALGEARSIYERLRKELPADDITPELFLYATLNDYYRYDEMQGLAREMLRRQPGNEEAKALAAGR